MKKTIILGLGILFFLSCSHEEKNGTIENVVNEQLSKDTVPDMSINGCKSDTLTKNDNTTETAFSITKQEFIQKTAGHYYTEHILYECYDSAGTTKKISWAVMDEKPIYNWLLSEVGGWTNYIRFDDSYVETFAYTIDPLKDVYRKALIKYTFNDSTYVMSIGNPFRFATYYNITKPTEMILKYADEEMIIVDILEPSPFFIDDCPSATFSRMVLKADDIPEGIHFDDECDDYR